MKTTQENKTPIELETPLELGDIDSIANDLDDEEVAQVQDTTTIPAKLIEEARIKYGHDSVKVLEIFLNEERTASMDVLVKVPSREIVGEYEKYSDRQPVKAKTILIKACVLTSREKILSDDGLFNGTVNLLAEMIPIRRGRIKNL